MFPTIYTEREFLVEIVNPCLTGLTEFMID